MDNGCIAITSGPEEQQRKKLLSGQGCKWCTWSSTLFERRSGLKWEDIVFWEVTTGFMTGKGHGRRRKVRSKTSKSEAEPCSQGVGTKNQDFVSRTDDHHKPDPQKQTNDSISADQLAFIIGFFKAGTMAIGGSSASILIKGGHLMRQLLKPYQPSFVTQQLFAFR